MSNEAIIANLKEIFTVRLSTRTRLEDSLMMKIPDNPADFVKKDMMADMATNLMSVARMSRTDNIKHGYSVFESDVFVLLDPSGFFEQLERELDAAYTHGAVDAKNERTVQEILEEVYRVQD